MADNVLAQLLAQHPPNPKPLYPMLVGALERARDWMGGDPSIPGTISAMAMALPAARGAVPMPRPERVERAAIMIGNRTFAGPNHAQAIRSAESSLGKPFDELVGAGVSDGFLTSSGRFVTREEATAIAEGAKQLKPQYGGRAPDSYLATEDMRRGAIWGGLPPTAVLIDALRDYNKQR